MAKRIEITQVFQNPPLDQTITLKGWVRAFRNNRFIALNDGSGPQNLQIVIEAEQMDEELVRKIKYHACISATGKLVTSQGSGQAFELLADTIEILGENNLDEYPLQPKRQTVEFLRQKAHFRMRTNTFSAVFRIRHAVAYAIHKFYNDNGFFYLHAPIVTGSDAEGAGEMFRVTTLDMDNLPRTEEGYIDWGQDFFGRSTNLTVSGQLQGEIGALALGKVYTFGPTFRAENSNTPRHLAEFWMIEPEMAFYDIHALRLEEEEKSLPKEKRRSMGLIEQLRFVVDNAFERITYTEAVELLLQSKPYKKGQFEFPVEWGRDLQAEHERYLVEKEFQKPVIVRNYPKDIKAFYMRLNEDNKTVAAMDVLFPGIGEVIGGSQREERFENLVSRIQEVGIPEEDLWWYLELRKFGGAPHSGFGLGFERMVQFITGMGNIRDVIPFPRTPGNADF